MRARHRGRDRRPTSRLGARRWVLAASGATALACVSLVALPAAQVAGGSAVTYVALGDSYTAGPLVPAQSTNPLGCLRSDHNYPSDTAGALGLSLVDMSCSGATTADMTGPQQVTPGPANPPQLGAIRASTRVVSLQIGGNDIGFVDIIENCAALTPWGPTKVGLNCRDHYDPGGNDHLGATIAALEPAVAAIIDQVHAQAPQAEVFVVGYPAILPASGSCWPSLPIEKGDAAYLRQKELQLDDVLQSAATQNGATYVDTYGASLTHDACAPESTRWVEPLVPDAPAAPVHPNAAGEAGMAALLESAIRATGI
ncbi:MAG TPA: SGNH/GDSL hydrolase family protein [Acidimicrobiales bacterium]|nr:SGNH/GDSL hydrolase family protein [Acidimicrobiales bacterium]